MKRKDDRQASGIFRRLRRKYSLVIVGAIIQGFAMGVFLFPNFIPSGGAGGFTVLLNYWFHMPLSIALWLVNSSMLLFAFHYLGSGSAIGTLFGITMTSISVNIFNVYLETPFSSVWVDLLVGSVFLGTGIAILLRQGVSNGGVGIIALIIAKYKNINPGKTLFWINGLIFIITAYIIDWQIIIQAIICQWLSTTIVSWLYVVSIPRKSLIFNLIWFKK
ncbi:YitT family protein [Psychrobacillus sp. FJAT-51614]|uniref:YitT family protein n=1 Tax=Psychrobacillus mangrovi TaxID=3117745 RepID=A0ABU8F4N2_9BACI